jgi:hypothetical protein
MNSLLKKHRLLIRKIVNKLLKKFGTAYVTKLMPEFHKKMIIYLEKEKRKKASKKEKNRILELMGEKTLDDPTKEGDEDSDDSSDDEENVLKKSKNDEESDDELSESELYIGRSG